MSSEFCTSFISALLSSVIVIPVGFRLDFATQPDLGFAMTTSPVGRQTALRYSGAISQRCLPTNQPIYITPADANSIPAASSGGR